jgi:hypothetical protein
MTEPSFLTRSRTSGDTTFVRGTHVRGHDATHYADTPHQYLQTARLLLNASGQMTVQKIALTPTNLGRELAHVVRAAFCVQLICFPSLWSGHIAVEHIAGLRVDSYNPQGEFRSSGPEVHIHGITATSAVVAHHDASRSIPRSRSRRRQSISGFIGDRRQVLEISGAPCTLHVFGLRGEVTPAPFDQHEGPPVIGRRIHHARVGGNGHC